MPTALVKRVASTVLLVPVVIWVVAAGPGVLLQLVVVLVGAATAWELARLFAQAGRPAAPRFTALAGAAVTASFAIPGAPIAVLAFVVMATLALAVWRPGAPSSEASLVTVLAVGYVAWLLGHLLLLQAQPGGRRLILFLLAVTWAGETAAYAAGTLAGRHKLAPRVSPGKTIEGAVAQVVASMAAAWALAGLGPPWSAPQAVALGALLGVVGQVGDLAESVIKRSVGAKDTGGVIPGHGGFLDRLDGLLFNAPALYYCAGVLSGGARA